MKLNGEEVFSRQTIVSWRVTVTICGTLIAIVSFGYNDAAWPILNRDVKEEHFETISALLLAFSFLSLLVNWYGDYVGLTMWFKTNKVAKDDLFSYGKFENTYSPIEALQTRLSILSDSTKDLDKSFDEFSKQGSFIDVLADNNNDQKALLTGAKESVEKQTKLIQRVGSEVSEIGKLVNNMSFNFRSISKLTKFLLYGWYFGLPFVLTSCALSLLWMS